MRRKLLTALGLSALAITTLAHDHKQTLLTYVGNDSETHDYWMRPMLAPLVEVHVMEGPHPTPEHRNMMCHWTRRTTDHKLADGTLLHSNVGVFLCEDGTVLEMTNVDFGEHQ